MSWFRRRDYIRWREPKPIQKYNLKHRRPKISRTRRFILTVLVITHFIIVCFLGMLVASLKSENSPPSFWKMMAFSFLFLAFAIAVSYLGIKLQSLLLPTKVFVLEHAIISIGTDHGRWEYKDIQSWHIESMNIDGNEFSILSIDSKKGKHGIIGIDPLVSLTELDTILSKLAGPQSAPPQSELNNTSG